MTARRVCFVTTFYPPYGFGGDGIAVQRLARALARRGFDVTVVHDADAHAVLGGQAKGLAPSPDPYGVQVITLRTPLPLVNTLLTQQVGRPVMNARRLRTLLDGPHFDAIIFNNISLVGGPGVLGYGNGAAKIYVAHEHWLVCPSHVLWRHNRERCDARECMRCQLAYHRPPQLWRGTGLLERELAHVDRFVAMTEFSRAKHREFGFTHKMDVLPHFLPDEDGADTSTRTSPSPHPKPFFLFVGRLERLKGLDDVLGTFNGADGADLVIVGEGSHGDALRQMASGLPRVRFVGRVANEDLEPYYRHALALIMPSVGFETFGITVIEAFSHGLPVIARSLGPFPELVEQSGAGVLFSTQADLSAAIDTFQTDTAYRRALGAAGLAAFRRYWSESAVVPRYVDLIETVCAEREARAS